ncbi:UDP-N-acetylmuramoyl-L-alanyl-D-glutamate--2,6-diaminopimelate ligase [bioreactor metagenome]|uniref:UDP-N-acetylmuramoyl-L-alanyl-D-glutamate--2, 6-diaminopimelate ligase n=1 Tax=bioreactor metagenome TaxID=1076179 RepID=A0A644T867_9ZZZZ
MLLNSDKQNTVKTLKEILYKCRIRRITGSLEVVVDEIIFDSRKAASGNVFVATRGTLTDGHNFIDDVVKAGVKAVICERMPDDIREDITYVEVENSAEAMALMASNFYDNPSAQIRLTGITGTNGKTTTATLLYQLFKNLGYKTGLISTVRNKIHDREIQATHTTPDAVALNALLRAMVDEGCEFCFMEVSSHAVVQHRVTGLTFAGGVFTNLTHDHLDFHKTFDAYLKAKKTFFDNLPAGSFAIVNADDRNGLVMVQNTRARVKTAAIKRQADFHCRILENHFDGLQLNINGNEVWCRLVGNFNAYNLLNIYATALMLGADEEACLTGLSELKAVDGRFEYIKSPAGMVGIVDYAHTPDALLNVISTINAIRGGKGRLITVVGAGGDRDRSKRPVMASIATENSDLTILTSDNPRTENPEEILNEMRSGVSPERKRHCLVISDRREAIRTACTMAAKDDIILIAGKGHETYQEVMGVKHHFDDREELREYFGILSKED